MAIALVDFEKVVKKYKPLVDASIAANTHATDSKKLDIKILTDLQNLVKTSLSHTDVFDKQASARHKSAKDLLDKMESIIKKAGKNINDDTLTALAKIQAELNDHNRFLKTMSAEMTLALVQFRGGWPESFKKLVANTGPVGAMQAWRAKSIDSGKQSMTLSNRVVEYAERGADLLKLAVKMQSNASAASSGSRTQVDEAELKGIENECSSITSKFMEFHRKAFGALERISKLDTKAKPAPKLLNNYESILLSGRADAKNARGQLKTLDMKIEAFKKSFAKLDETSKKLVAATLKKLQEALKEMESEEKALNKIENSADKNFLKIIKLK